MTSSTRREAPSWVPLGFGLVGGYASVYVLASLVKAHSFIFQVGF